MFKRGTKLKGIPVLFQGSFESTKRPRVVGFRCRILDNGLFILKLSGSCGSVMTRAASAEGTSQLGHTNFDETFFLD